MEEAHHYNRYRPYNNSDRELSAISFCIDVVQQTLPHWARLGAATLFFPFYFGFLPFMERETVLVLVPGNCGTLSRSVSELRFKDVFLSMVAKEAESPKVGRWGSEWPS